MINILIADDHQLLIDGIKTTLAGEDDIQIVAEANNGYKVIEKLESGSQELSLHNLDCELYFLKSVISVEKGNLAFKRDITSK